jgi:hypothetical protein
MGVDSERYSRVGAGEQVLQVSCEVEGFCANVKVAYVGDTRLEFFLNALNRASSQ